MFAIRWPPKPGTVCTSRLRAIFKSVQWALRPVPSRAATRAAIEAVRVSQPASSTSGSCRFTSSASTWAYAAAENVASDSASTE